ncbi:hypothetical protein JCM11491_003223, partial [Sporobolomyces phaffii]
MAELPALSTTRPDDWTYLAEGGANLVLAYSPSPRSSSSSSDSPDSPYRARVLRLRKRELGGGPRGGRADDEFHASVIKRLLPGLAVDLERVSVDRAWLREVVERLGNGASRPVERTRADEVDLECESAVVAEDLVGGRGVIAVEIK